MPRRLTYLPWTQQPQGRPVRPSPAYADLHAAFIGGTDALIGAAPATRWTQVGDPSSVASIDGIASLSPSYSDANWWSGPSIDGGSLSWPGITVVAVMTTVDLTSGNSPAIVSILNTQLYGICALYLRRQAGSGKRDIAWRAGNNSAYLTTDTYAIPGTGQWVGNDRLVIVARWDMSTISLAVSRNGSIVTNSNAHAYSWMTGSHLMLVGGHTYSGTNRSLTSPLALAAVIPRDVGRNAETELLANPWQIFEPRRRLRETSSGGGGFQVAWTANANTMIQGSLQ